MRKKLLSGLFWILLANLIVKPLWLLGIEVGVQNAVGTEMYGFYFGIFNITYIFNILLDLGITNFNTRNIARHPRLIDKHLPAILGIKLLLLGLYLLVTFSVGLLLGYGSMQFRLLAWLTLNQFLSSLILYLRSNFEGLLLFKWDSLLSILDRLLMIFICGMMLWGWRGGTAGGFTIFHFVYAQTAAYLVTAIVACTVLARRTGLRRLRLNLPFTLVIIKKSLPFALLVLLMASYNRIDPILLQKLSLPGTGDYNAGIYAGAFRLLDALTMIAYLFSVPLLPIFSKMTKADALAHGNGELRNTVRLVFSLIMVFALTAACTLACIDDELMALLYDGNTSDYASVFRILVFGIIPISVTYVFGTLLTAGGKLRQLNIFAATSLVVNVVINILLIPRFGAVGSAWAGLSAQVLMAVTQLVAALCLFKIPLSGGFILKLSLFALSVVGCALLLPHPVWWPPLLIIPAVAVAMALLLRLIDIKEITKILKEQEK